MNSEELQAWWDSAASARQIADRAAMRITYETARRMHEGWYADEEDTPVPTSTSDDPWEVMPCGRMRGELHPESETP
jgi:hypothetical protein